MFDAGIVRNSDVEEKAKKFFFFFSLFLSIVVVVAIPLHQTLLLFFSSSSIPSISLLLRFEFQTNRRLHAHTDRRRRGKTERDRYHDGLDALDSPLILQPFTRNAAGKGRWVVEGVECLSSASVEFRTVARLWKLPYYPSLGEV